MIVICFDQGQGFKDSNNGKFQVLSSWLIKTTGNIILSAFLLLLKLA